MLIRESNFARKNTVIYLIILMSIFLNHQKPIQGVNISISDFILLLLLALLIIYNKLTIPKKALLFFMLLSLVTLTTSFFISPYKFNLSLDIISIVSDYIKLVVSFLYFLIGYNISKSNKDMYIYRWYSLAAIAVGIVGIILVFLNIHFFRDFFFYLGTRFVGLMSDPNYFALIQCSALPFIMNNKFHKGSFKLLATVVILLSILIAGSKTGILIFILYLLWFFLRSLFKKNSKKNIILKVVVLLVVFLMAPFLYNMIGIILDQLSHINPVINRTRILFTDFESAISSDGSSRTSTWSGALDTIQQAPIFGVGVGSYLAVRASRGGGGFAHNTYLQIIAEWGIPLSFILFIYMGYTLYKTKKSHGKSNVIIARDSFLIFLLGSFSLSLNNARMLWVFFGVLVGKHNRYKKN